MFERLPVYTAVILEKVTPQEVFHNAGADSSVIHPYDRGARWRIELYDTDKWYFKRKADATLFIKLHGLLQISTDDMAIFRRALYITDDQDDSNDPDSGGQALDE